MASFRPAARKLLQQAQAQTGAVSRRTVSTAPRRSQTLWQSAAVGLASGVIGAAVNDHYGDHIKAAFRSVGIAENDAAAKPDVPDSSKPGGFRIDSATDMPFPITLQPATSSPVLALVGLGVRTVSFLRVKVYSAGFYLQESATQSLDSVPGWKTYTAQHLLTPPTNPSSPTAGPQMSGEALIKNLLEQPVACAVRIVPARNTDFGHLRDGFTRAIAARQKLARAAGTLTDADEERIAASTQALKAIFPAQSVPKGKALTMLRTATGNLIVEYEGKVLGNVDDTWMSRELMLAYFADEGAISPKLKEDVAKGFEAFAQHPAGMNDRLKRAAPSVIP